MRPANHFIPGLLAVALCISVVSCGKTQSPAVSPPLAKNSATAAQNPAAAAPQPVDDGYEKLAPVSELSIQQIRTVYLNAKSPLDHGTGLAPRQAPAVIERTQVQPETAQAKITTPLCVAGAEEVAAVKRSISSRQLDALNARDRLLQDAHGRFGPGRDQLLKQAAAIEMEASQEVARMRGRVAELEFGHSVSCAR